MNNWRIIVAAALVLFAWNGSKLSLPWPPEGPKPVVPTPEPILLAWAEPLRPILPKMLVKDRTYLSNLYDAMSFVLVRDSKRDNPVIATTGDFVQMHAESLQLAIDKDDVGKYPGLGEAIDESFFNAIGADQRAMSDEDRTKLIACCSTLAYCFRVGGDE